MLLQLDQLEKRIGGRTLFADASLMLRSGDRVGLVGPNGAGKTTLLRILAGDEGADGGELRSARGLRIGMLRQEIDPTLDRSVRAEAATAFAELDALEEELRQLEAEMTAHGREGRPVPVALAERYDRASSHYEHQGGFDRAARVASVLGGLGFDDAACDRPLSSFSGGWLMRVELAKLILASPDVLLLDEPTNHLDLPSIRWFEESLAAFDGALVTVSHDRTFLRRQASRIAELDGYGRWTVYEGNYDRYLQEREERRAHLLARKANQDREIAQMERFVERFRAKSSKAKQAQSRIKALERIDRIEIDDRAPKAMRLRIPPPPRAGQVVISLSGVEKRYGENQVYAGVDFAVQRGERVALAGPNGAGKSTLLRIVAGVLEADGGDRVVGHNVSVAFFAQHQLESLEPTRSVLAELEAFAEMEDIPRVRSHLGAFLFSGDEVDKKIAVLSGGEKARVALAKLLLRPSNLLVLDEPTNHLDIESCEVLEHALSDYAGTVVFVSHDRSFINALATRVVEVRGGTLREFIGNYDDYVAKLRELDGRSGEGSASDATTEAKPRSQGKEARAQVRQRKKKRDVLRKKVEKLERAIAEGEREIEALHWRMGDPATSRDAEALQALSSARDSQQETVDALYRDWERQSVELEALNDELEGGVDPA